MKIRTNRKVMVSGCFDNLHSGHVAFLREAAFFEAEEGTVNTVVVVLGTDANIAALKGRPPRCSQAERFFTLANIKPATIVQSARSSGILDFEENLLDEKPEIFAVKPDGHTEAKRELCERHGVRYVILDDSRPDYLPNRRSSKERDQGAVPYRLCIAGGWLDQPFVSDYFGWHTKGSVIVARMRPDRPFMERAGLATSTRKTASDLWGTIPDTDEETARLLFNADNGPGTEYVSGSQDALGLVLPGVSRLVYEREQFWPSRIETLDDPETLAFLHENLFMIPLAPRPDDYSPTAQKNLSHQGVARLVHAGNLAWQGIVEKDADKLGEGMTKTVEAWKELLPLTVFPEHEEPLRSCNALHKGATLSGCGGGYLVGCGHSNYKDSFRPTFF